MDRAAADEAGGVATGGRPHYQEQLADVRAAVLALGEMAVAALERAGQALRRGDAGLAQRVVEEDRAIHERRFAVEDAALRVLATQQPVASGGAVATRATHVRPR